MRFDLTDLRLFLAVVEHGSLTSGARAVHLALASASERISGMESEMGAPLFERTRRGVSTTDAGTALTKHAHLILDQVEQMRGELRTYGNGLKGRIRLLSNTAALAVFLPNQLCLFLAAHPELSVDVEERPSAEIVLAVAERKADLGVVADVADLSTLQTHLIAHDRLVVVTNKEHRLSTMPGVAFREIVDEAFVSLSDAALEIYLGEQATRLGRHIQYRTRLRSVEKVGMLIEAGVGISIMPEVCAAELHPRDRNLSIHALLEPWASRRLHLCCRDFSLLPPHVALLAQQLIDSGSSQTSGSSPTH